MDDSQKPAPRVLIVEDCPDTAQSMLMLLEAWGFPACVAADAESGYQQAQLWAPAVVLLDIGLPRVSGWVLARRLREMPSMESALIVAISGFGGEDDRAHSLEAGCDLHLNKPVELDCLRMLLQVGLKRRKQHLCLESA